MAKKLLALALALLMLCSVVPFAAFADDEVVDAEAHALQDVSIEDDLHKRIGVRTHLFRRARQRQ